MSFLLDGLLGGLAAWFAQRRSRNASATSLAPHWFNPKARRCVRAFGDAEQIFEVAQAIATRHGVARHVGGSVDRFVIEIVTPRGGVARLSSRPTGEGAEIALFAWYGGAAITDFGESKRTLAVIADELVSELGAELG